MTLIKSVSGIRGTIGGYAYENLTPIDVVNFVAGFCQWLKNRHKNNKVVVGRDARMSGAIIKELSIHTILAMGFDVIDLDLSTTPTVEIAIVEENACGGIILTASHNPKEWNALKLLNHHGEFIGHSDGQQLLQLTKEKAFVFASVNHLGSRIEKNYLDIHINRILKYHKVDMVNIISKNFSVVVDGINSSGAVYVKALLLKLGVKNVEVLNAETHGNFAHNPEPLEEYLGDLKNAVVARKADIGIAVDPDVDRLCFVNEDGSMFGEEYTLVAIAEYYLKEGRGNTVSNLSSTQALKDVTERYGGQYFSSRVGEVYVVEKMKEKKAIIGGEGNGGIIVPDFHYGRDALIGIALFLSYFSQQHCTMSEFRKSLPQYFMAKTKIDLNGQNTQQLFSNIKKYFSNAIFNEEDGLKIIFEKQREWIHIRTSNTEPIIRIYTESPIKERSMQLVNDIKKLITSREYL